MMLTIKDNSKSYKDLNLEEDTNFETIIRNLCGLFVNVIDQKIYLIYPIMKEFLIIKKSISSMKI